jgi:hypothetical protein
MIARHPDMRTAIQTGNAEALRRLLTSDPSRANALIRWGKNDCILTHPLHYVSDMLFEGTLKRGTPASGCRKWRTASTVGGASRPAMGRGNA